MSLGFIVFRVYRVWSLGFIGFGFRVLGFRVLGCCDGLGLPCTKIEVLASSDPIKLYEWHLYTCIWIHLFIYVSICLMHSCIYLFVAYV